MPTLSGSDEAIILARNFLKERVSGHQSSHAKKDATPTSVAAAALTHLGKNIYSSAIELIAMTKYESFQVMKHIDIVQV